jgi:hypothetical protein
MPELIKPLLAVRLYSSEQAQQSGQQGVIDEIPTGSEVEVTNDPCRLRGFLQITCDGHRYAAFADSLDQSISQRRQTASADCMTASERLTP